MLWPTLSWSWISSDTQRMRKVSQHAAFPGLNWHWTADPNNNTLIRSNYRSSCEGGGDYTHTHTHTLGSVVITHCANCKWYIGKQVFLDRKLKCWHRPCDDMLQTCCRHSDESVRYAEANATNKFNLYRQQDEEGPRSAAAQSWCRCRSSVCCSLSLKRVANQQKSPSNIFAQLQAHMVSVRGLHL